MKDHTAHKHLSANARALLGTVSALGISLGVVVESSTPAQGAEHKTQAIYMKYESRQHKLQANKMKLERRQQKNETVGWSWASHQHKTQANQLKLESHQHKVQGHFIKIEHEGQ